MMHGQRWIEHECRWVPERHIVDTSTLEVEQLDEASAKAFVLEHHYSKSYPAARFRFGLYQFGRLVGVAVLSEPANPRVIPHWTGYPREHGAELGRFVLLDEVGYNAESFFFGQIRRQLRVIAPELRTLVAYSDPVVRTKRSGEAIFLGHHGQIYQATNARYRGRASRRKLYLDDEGRVISGRLLSKIRNGESGKDYARTKLEEASHTVQALGESAADWVTRALASCRRLSHKGNHVYIWGITRRDKVPESLAYPKHLDPQLELGI